MARLTNQQLQEQLEQLARANEELAREVEAQRVAAEQARADVDAEHAVAEQARADVEAERIRSAEAIEAARVEALAEARAQVDAAAVASVKAGTAGVAAVKTKKKRSWGWTLLATVLVVVASLLAPVSVVSSWAQRELTNTDYFVNTFAPLAKKPAVQNLVVTQSVAAIEANVDIKGITSDVFTGIENLGLPPRASSALGTLQAPLVAGIKSLITSTVTSFVQSDAFATIWKQALTTTHTQLLATLRGDKNAAVTVGTGGQIGLQLGPIIEAVKKQLVDQGFTFAKSIPAINRTIVIAQSNSVSLYIGLYNLVVAVGIWLPWVVLVLLAAGVLVARRRTIALIWASFALGLTMVLVGIGISVGKTIFQLSVADVIPADAAGTIYSGILQFVQSIVVAVAVLAFTVFVIAVLSGPFRWAAALRGYVSSGFAAARRGAERHGISTGKVGDWMYRQRLLLRVLVGLIAAAIVVFGRPLTPPLIVWTAVIAIVVVAVLELLARPPVEADETDAATPFAATA
ncbi:hypothetical protein [Humibacter sp. RRB41]|uniref:hypothetical protein n=1 Tax=Humibacter sp. RRB41 TaxID=2919946 RepID=UPI001FA9ABE2|nr:hypothetical protein [Humibacter sp. RRB41]